MQNKDNCYGWLVSYKKFLINSWKFVLIKYSRNSYFVKKSPVRLHFQEECINFASK